MTLPLLDMAPVAATLAGLPGRLGLDALVLGKNREIYPMPRAVGFDRDAIRLFQRVGVCDSIKPFNELKSGATSLHWQ